MIAAYKRLIDAKYEKTEIKTFQESIRGYTQDAVQLIEANIGKEE